MGLLGNNKLPNINGHTLSPKSKMKQDCNGMQEGQHQSQLTQSL